MSLQLRGFVSGILLLVIRHTERRRFPGPLRRFFVREQPEAAPPCYHRWVKAVYRAIMLFPHTEPIDNATLHLIDGWPGSTLIHNLPCKTGPRITFRNDLQCSSQPYVQGQWDEEYDIHMLSFLELS